MELYINQIHNKKIIEIGFFGYRLNTIVKKCYVITVFNQV